MNQQWFVTVFVWLMVFVNCSSEEDEDGDRQEACFGNICLEDNYDINIMPNHSRPIMVTMKFDVDKMIAVDTDLNIMGVQMSLTQTWQDDRIRFKTQIDYGEWVAAPLMMFKEPDNLPKIWIPRLWVHSMAKFEVKRTYDDQSYLAVERVNYTSNLLRQQNITNLKRDHYFVHYLTQFDVYVKCSMDHYKFPFEEHICNISMTSSDLHNKYIIFENTTHGWNTWNPSIEKRHQTRYFAAEIEEQYTYDKDYDDGNKWSTTGFRIRLRRRRSEFIWNYMFPSGLCVVVSWSTFVLPSKNVEGRIAIMITMILVLVTIFNGVIEKTPRASRNLTALTVWMLSMFSFVFVAFVTYCIELTLKPDIKSTSKVGPQPDNMKKPNDCNSEHVCSSQFPYSRQHIESIFNKHKSDIVTFITLTISFILYLIIYFSCYLS